MLNDPVTMAWYAPGNWPELPRTAPMSLNEIGSVGTVAKKKRLNPARKSLTKWGDRTLVKPTFTNLFLPGANCVNGSVPAVPNGRTASFVDWKYRNDSLLFVVI